MKWKKQYFICVGTLVGKEETKNMRELAPSFSIESKFELTKLKVNSAPAQPPRQFQVLSELNRKIFQLDQSQCNSWQRKGSALDGCSVC